ncbi:MAG: hypothetical protein VW270_02200 [Candidatus Poseidoniales archaeon]
MAAESKPNIIDSPEEFSNASNETDAIETFENRLRYREEIFPDSSPFSFFNFWQEDRYYGRINHLGNAVVLREDRLKQLKYCDSPDPLFAFNFVADAWSDFVEKVRDEVIQGRIPNSGPYANMAAKKSWQSIPTQYYDHMINNVYPVLTDTYLGIIGNNNKRVRDFDTFLEVFTEFSEVGLTRGAPITLCGYIESILCSPLNSGLVIEISDADHSSDYSKCDEFLFDQNYEVTIRLASNYGFVIDKNAPWRFVADIRSPAMREYMTGVPMEQPPVPLLNTLDKCDVPFIRDFNVPGAYGFSNIEGIRNVVRRAPGYEEYDKLKTLTAEEDIFEEFFIQAYTEAWSVDMDILKTYLFDFYNTYVSTVPVVSTRSLRTNFGEFRCTNPSRPEYKTDVIFRQTIESISFLYGNTASKYGDKWSLKSYYNLRTLERRHNKSIRQISKDISQLMNIYYFAPRVPEGTKYQMALKTMQEKVIGPVTTDFLTSGNINDKLGNKESSKLDISNIR